MPDARPQDTLKTSMCAIQLFPTVECPAVGRPAPLLRWQSDRHLGAPANRNLVLGLYSTNTRNAIRITPDTPVPHWYGEKMDDNLAVQGLLARE